MKNVAEKMKAAIKNTLLSLNLNPELVDEYIRLAGEVAFVRNISRQTPAEDVGGVGGFVSFREIMLNPDHPENMEMKEWSRYWSPELREWNSRPKAIHTWW